MDSKNRLHRRLVEILALPAGPHEPLEASVELRDDTGACRVYRVEYTSEPGERVPGYLLVPVHGEPPFPVMVCLQGHSPGMHISIGLAMTDRDRESIAGGRDVALQAVRQGWAALAIEQRGFGERAQDGVACQDASLHALHRGRPMTGGRVLDVMRAIDFIGTRPELDSRRIGCMGNSAGGTVTFYSACVDRRIRLAVVSCSFCPFRDSWLAPPPRCACGYLPGIYEVADMPELAGLIAPRRLIIVAGRNDHLAPVESVREGFEIARSAYSAEGAGENIRLLVGEGAHRFYPELAWPAVGSVVESMWWDV